VQCVGEDGLRLYDAASGLQVEGIVAKRADAPCENGVRLYQAAAELGVEGILAKRADSLYRRGRTSDWLKIKTPAGKAIDEERAKWNETR
jgi:bifunctional non-homologous end joining protein LigD